MDPAKGDAKGERKEEEKQAKRRESVSSNSDGDDEDEDDFFQLDHELTNPFLGHVNDGGIVGSGDGRLSSPPVQMMWRSPDAAADPNRIPSSIFAGPSSPMEWSAASNESLFSIHGGNSSFTRDHVTLMEKSGELNLPAEDHHHHPPLPPPQALPAVAGTETDNAKSIKELVQANAEEQQHRSSDCSAVSYQSFAFPILAGEGRTCSVKVESVHPFRPSKSQKKQPPLAAAPPNPASPPPPLPSTSPAKKSQWFPCACVPSFCSQGNQ